MKKNFLTVGLFLLILVMGCNLQAEENNALKQNLVTTIANDTIYQMVDEMAMFPGGYEALAEYLGKSIKYPKKARKAGTQGRVFLSFVIEKDGSVSNVEVLKGISKACDKEAIRVVKAMPRWKPAKNKGEVVRQQFNLPITFTLSKED